MKGIRPVRLDIAVAAVVLMPFATVGLGFRGSLVVQAVGILAVVLATVPALGATEGRRRVMTCPRPVIVGIAAVAVATVGGGLVGLLRGHATSQLAGQVLAMGLLPLAAVGGLAAWRDGADRQWKVGLLSAVTLGCWIQLLFGAVEIVVLGEPSRLFLPNSVSVIGPALMGLCFALVSTRDSERWMRRLAWTATLSIGLVILGSSLRSLWILTPLTVVGLVVVWKGVRSRASLIALLSVVLLGLAMVFVGLQTEKWVSKDMPDALDRTPCSLFPKAGQCVSGGIEYDPDGVLSRRFDSTVELNDAEAWRLRIRGRGEGRGAMVVALLFFDESKHQIGRISVPIRPGFGDVIGTAVGTVRPGWTEVRLRLSRWEGSTGRWHLDSVECAALESHAKTRLAAKVLAVKERVWALTRAVRSGRPDGDTTLGFRWHESDTIIKELVGGTWIDLLFGKGLGATVRLDVEGFDNRGNWVYYDEVNYIHNWYLFLLFKLGIVGSVLVLGALVGWIFWSVRGTARACGSEARAFLAAAAGAWIVYSVWSVTSPEILDFRMAPLWGWLLAVTSVVEGNRPDPS